MQSEVLSEVLFYIFLYIMLCIEAIFFYIVLYIESEIIKLSDWKSSSIINFGSSIYSPRSERTPCTTPY
jgi:hypothetical protein